jgi:hypothetical protein
VNDGHNLELVSLMGVDDPIVFLMSFSEIEFRELMDRSQILSRLPGPLDIHASSPKALRMEV